MNISSPSISLLLLVAIICSLSISVEGEEPVCQNDEACSGQQHNPKTWFDEASKEGLKFLQENVFGQKIEKVKQFEERKESFRTLFQSKSENKNQSSSKQENGEAKGILETLKGIFDSDNADVAVLNFLLKESASHEDSNEARSFEDTAMLFFNHVKEIRDQLQRVLGDRLDNLMKEYFFLPSAWYMLRKEQETKHPYWKTSQHRFFEKVTDVAYFRELHQALYLSNLAYVDTKQEVVDGLAKIDNGAWQLLFCDTEGNPKEPAHFVAVEKQAAPMPSKDNAGFWKKAARTLQLDIEDPENDSLKVLIVVRGTKTIADILSDGLLEATPFKEQFKAHGGIASSGKYIANKHIGRLTQLLEVSGRSKLQVILMGHSLGCGTAAIAAMELHDNFQDIMTVQSVGFGCPSLVSPEVSEKYKSIITTVVADADVVPRMSGSSLVNLQLQMMSLDWTDYMWEELQDVGANIIKEVTEKTGGVATKLVTELLTKIGEFIQNRIAEIRPKIVAARDHAIPSAFPVRKVDNELIPPGTCLHLFRTATGFDAAYTPCTFFDEIEYVPHLVDDHMCNTGYHFALLHLLRQGLQDDNANFDNVLYP